MLFKCENCGGNTVYSPEKKAMYCPHCEGIESQKKVTGENNLQKCINCGAPLEISDDTSATKCEHCGCYLVFDERIEGEYKPHLLVPFKIGKEGAKEIMRTRFKAKAFTPSNFLSDAMLEKMEGRFVPFFMYDMNVECDYHGEGIKRRVWTTGDTEYTETSYYDVRRNMFVDFDKIPVDASTKMDDGVMDLMEPYEYGELADFDEKYMSGFFGEKYSSSAEELSPRAKDKATQSSESLLRESIAGYSSVHELHKNINIQNREVNYTLMPIWIYHYSFQGKDYAYYINGQTGKAVGNTPVSGKKVIAYGASVWILLTAMLQMANIILGVI